MNKYTKQLQAKFDELYEEMADDFCPSEFHDEVRKSFEEDIGEMACLGCLFQENGPDAFKEHLCELSWPCMICCMKSHIRSQVYQECGIYDEIVNIKNKY